jgi:hypothetical protein
MAWFSSGQYPHLTESPWSTSCSPATTTPTSSFRLDPILDGLERALRSG